MNVSMRDMLEAGVHFGHQTKFWNPKMKPFIFGVRNKIHIINLDKTVVCFEEALKFVNQVVRKNGTVLFVGTRMQASKIIAEEAKRCGMSYIDKRWLGGMLTNFETVKKSIQKLETKKILLDKGEESGLSKKELLDLTRDVAKLEASIGGITNMKKQPSLIFIIDTGCHDIAIKEAKKLGIPVVGVVDTNNDPTLVDYVIPGNDDSSKAIHLYTSAVADVILKAKEVAIQELKMELVDSTEESSKKRVRTIKSNKDKTESEIQQLDTVEDSISNDPQS